MHYIHLIQQVHPSALCELDISAIRTCWGRAAEVTLDLRGGEGGGGSVRITHYVSAVIEGLEQ